MTKNQIIAKAIKAALETTLNGEQGTCFPCGFHKSDEEENAMIIILQEMLTLDEYNMLGILIRRDSPWGSDFYLPRYGHHAGCYERNRCFSIFEVLMKHVETVVNRKTPDHILQPGCRG